MMTAVKRDESGQALVELIVFLPLMFGLYAMISGFAGAINAAINQQKITRGYMYFRLQNNSYFPKPTASQIGDDGRGAWSLFSMQIIGWRVKFIGDHVPVMPCYKVSLPLGTPPKDECESAYSEDSTQWVRVGTVYGLCGATFYVQDTKAHYAPDGVAGNFQTLVDNNSCTIR